METIWVSSCKQCESVVMMMIIICINKTGGSVFILSAALWFLLYLVSVGIAFC